MYPQGIVKYRLVRPSSRFLSAWRSARRSPAPRTRRSVTRISFCYELLKICFYLLRLKNTNRAKTKKKGPEIFLFFIIHNNEICSLHYYYKEIRFVFFYELISRKLLGHFQKYLHH